MEIAVNKRKRTDIYLYIKEIHSHVFFDVLRNLHIENPFLRPVSLSMLENDEELFWHQSVVAVGSRLYLNNLSKKLDGNHVELGRRIGGALLHDIGKFAVAGNFETGEAGTIEDSLRIVNYLPPGFIKGKSQLNLRPKDIIAKSHLHPFIGYEIIKEIFNEINKTRAPDNQMSESQIEEYAKIALNHHRSDNEYRTSYPGEQSLEGKNRRQVASEYLMEIMDFTIAMLSDRNYRDPLDRKVVNEEMERFFSNDALLGYILPVFECVSVFELKDLLYTQAQNTLDQIRSYINLKPGKKQLKKFIGGRTKSINLQKTIVQVWKKNHQQFKSAYDYELVKGFFAHGRD